MRVAVVVDGNRETVEVDLAASTVELRGTKLSVKVVEDSANRVSLEIAGEQVSVEGWPSGWRRPEVPVDVNGERRTVLVEAVSAFGDSPAPSIRVESNPSRSVLPVPPTLLSESAIGSEEGNPVMPPMPGKVIELLVQEGQKVERGQRLLVLEAMKMRNEIVSPRSGRVSKLRVQAGDFVPARRPMMFILSD